MSNHKKKIQPTAGLTARQTKEDAADLEVQAAMRLAQSQYQAMLRLRLAVLTAAALLEGGFEIDQFPLRHYVITLRYPDRTLCYPAFQFNASGQPYPVVLRINEAFNVKEDPWGVADWWIDADSRINNASPASLLGGPREDELYYLAAANLNPHGYAFGFPD